ncbi:hypothetical protein DY048_07905 [Apilactobacillus timberlakei]|uniref:Cardiolipin synthase N-terminal domain-containing protein n=1 Tax=Apilactobacillus timberlakei TaxID=2008380 RepID=A0ABY2YV66_9LACO|nr:hypothetical protein DY048_07905 [Apilactobacillus timberlakei]TPR12915.1 hypothetical protein DY052_09010 [Apilactobacillus timberlakei]
MNLRIIIPLIFIFFLYLYLCINFILKTNQTRFLPKWLWAILCVISIPLGGILFIIFGRKDN